MAAVMSGSRDPHLVGGLGFCNAHQELVDAVADTYYVGQMVMFCPDDSGLFKVASGSVGGGVGAGVSVEAKTLAAAGHLKLETGVHEFEIDSAAPISADDVGKLCYIRDDLTVSLSSNSGARNIAGRVFGMAPSGNAYVLQDHRLIVSGTTV